MNDGLVLALGAALLWVPPASSAELPNWYPSTLVDSTLVRLLETPEEPDAEAPDVVRVVEDLELDVRDASERRLRTRRIVHVLEGKGNDETSIGLIENYWTTIRRMKAWHQAADGTVQESDERIKSQLGEELYDDSVQHTLLVREVAAGSTILFETETVDRRADESVKFFFLPEDVPVGRWQCTVLHPEGTQVRASWLFDPLADPVPVSPGSTSPGETRWEIDATPEGAEVFALNLVDSTGARWPLRSWEDVGLWFRELTISALTESPHVAERAQELIAGIDDPEERIRRILQYVQGSVAYVQVYLDDGGWRPHRAGETLTNRYGDCKDMAHLAVALLIDAGVDAYPALTNVGDELWSGFPARGQFDHCIVALRGPERTEGWRFFDPTSKATPFGRIPASIEGKAVLIAGVNPAIGLLDLPRSRSDENEVLYQATLQLDEAGALAGHIDERRTGHAGFELRRHLRELSETKRIEWLKERLESHRLEAEVTRLEIVGLEAPLDTLVLRYDIESRSGGKRAGSRFLVQPDFLSARRATFLDDDDEDTEFSFPYVSRSRIEIGFPSTWEVESVPTAVEEATDLATYLRRVEAGDGRIQLERVERLEETRPRDEALEAIRRWDDAAYQADRKQVVLRVP